MVMTDNAAPQIVSQRVQDEDGKWLTINVARTPGAVQSQVIDIGQQQNPGEAAGKKPTLTSVGRRRIWMYRGAVGSLVPEAHMLAFMDRGFTAQPTAEGKPLNFVCGVEKDNGEPCDKRMPSRIDRLRHINAYHKDVAAWTLTDQEKRALRGDLGVGSLDPTAAPGQPAHHESPEVAALREEVARLTALFESAANGTVAAPKPARAPKTTGKHTHKVSFGRKVAGCPACDELLAKAGG